MRLVSTRMALVGAILLAPCWGTARAQDCASAVPAIPGGLPTQVTPLTLRVLQGSIVPVPATDGLIHLAYAAQMTNLNPARARIDLIVPVDPFNGFQPTGRNFVIDGDNKNITGFVRPFRPPLVDGVVPTAPVDTKFLDGGGSGISFFDITYPRMKDVPRFISHRISVTYPNQTDIEYTDGVPVSCKAPVVLSPPLVGPRWWNSNGCCEIVSLHRGATLPINGDLRPPEQFAIDYEQLTPQNTCCTGPVKELSSWPFFGAPILAAADGTVVDKLDGMPEQIPGQVVGVNAQNAPGNSIIEDIGGGRYILYAHMKTGSIPRRIVVGTKLTRGEQIGQVGNTGSSTAPHLHFQVMDRPSALNAVGLPFVFDRQILEGRVAGPVNDADKIYERGDAVNFIPLGAPRTQLGRMPAATQVFGYNIQ